MSNSLTVFDGPEQPVRAQVAVNVGLASCTTFLYRKEASNAIRSLGKWDKLDNLGRSREAQKLIEFKNDIKCIDYSIYNPTVARNGVPDGLLFERELCRDLAPNKTWECVLTLVGQPELKKKFLEMVQMIALISAIKEKTSRNDLDWLEKIDHIKLRSQSDYDSLNVIMDHAFYGRYREDVVAEHIMEKFLNRSSDIFDSTALKVLWKVLEAKRRDTEFDQVMDTIKGLSEAACEISGHEDVHDLALRCLRESLAQEWLESSKNGYAMKPMEACLQYARRAADLRGENEGKPIFLNEFPTYYDSFDMIKMRLAENGEVIDYGENWSDSDVANELARWTVISKSKRRASKNLLFRIGQRGYIMLKPGVNDMKVISSSRTLMHAVLVRNPYSYTQSSIDLYPPDAYVARELWIKAIERRGEASVSSIRNAFGLEEIKTIGGELAANTKRAVVEIGEILLCLKDLGAEIVTKHGWEASLLGGATRIGKRGRLRLIVDAPIAAIMWLQHHYGPIYSATCFAGDNHRAVEREGVCSNGLDLCIVRYKQPNEVMPPRRSAVMQVIETK